MSCHFAGQTFSVSHDVFAAIARLSLREGHIRDRQPTAVLFRGRPNAVNGILIVGTRTTAMEKSTPYGRRDWPKRILGRLNLLMFWRPESIATMPAGVRAEKHVLETATSEQISDVG